MPSTIVLSPLRDDAPLPFEVISLSIHVQDGDFVGRYDELEVWRSRSGASGPYEELTASIWRPARLPSYAGDFPTPAVVGPSVSVVGEVLQFQLKEADVLAVTFTGTNPLTLTQVATQITAQSEGRLRAYVDSLAQLTVETLEPGTGATLRVLPSDTASFLALPTEEPDSLAFGKDARIRLVAGLGVYHFSDVSGSTSNFYRTRFRNRSTATFSEFSLPFSATPTRGVSATNLVQGYLNLATADGRPLVGRSVSLASEFNGESTEDWVLAGGTLLQTTDEDGHVEFTLVRGQKYALAIAGINLSKEVVAPTSPSVTAFNLVGSVGGVQDDYFLVREPEVGLLERRHI